MRPSKQKTCLAVLRVRIDKLMTEAGEPNGFDQKAMAELLGKSVATIQSIETGRLKLSPELAKIVSIRTGVSLKWLLDGDPQAPMTGIVMIKNWPGSVTEKTHPEISEYVDYRLECFELAKHPTATRAAAMRVWSELTAQTAQRIFNDLARRAMDSDDHAILTWKLRNAADMLAKEFPAES